MATTNLISQQNNSCVYGHYSEDSNEIFYVGKSCNKKRPYSEDSRNPLWKNVINKHGYYVVIIKDELTNEEACKLEIEIIDFYGRRDIGTGTLVNMTIGGDNGTLGYKHSDKTREKISKQTKGKSRSFETKQKMSKRMVGNTYSLGNKFTDEHKEQISKRMLGNKVSDETKFKIGKSNSGKVFTDEHKEKLSSSRKDKKAILDTKTGIYYDSLKDASDEFGLSKQTLSRYLNGKRNNKTSLVWVLNKIK